MKEQWKDIEGFKWYQISNLGRVRRLAHSEEYKTRTTVHYKEMILTPQVISNNKNIAGEKTKGYLGIRLNGTQLYIHRLVAEAFIDKIDERDFVNHKDEDHYNNTVDNLEWVSILENINYGTRNERVSKALKGNTNRCKYFYEGKPYIKHMKSLGVKPVLAERYREDIINGNMDVEELITISNYNWFSVLMIKDLLDAYGEDYEEYAEYKYLPEVRKHLNLKKS